MSLPRAHPGEMMTMGNRGHHGISWSTMVVHGRPSNTVVMTMVKLHVTMYDYGRPWSTMVDHGQYTYDHGRPWSDLCVTVDGRPRSTMVKLHMTMVDHSRPWLTVGDHGQIVCDCV